MGVAKIIPSGIIFFLKKDLTSQKRRGKLRLNLKWGVIMCEEARKIIENMATSSVISIWPTPYRVVDIPISHSTWLKIKELLLNENGRQIKSLNDQDVYWSEKYEYI